MAAVPFILLCTGCTSSFNTGPPTRQNSLTNCPRCQSPHVQFSLPAAYYLAAGGSLAAAFAIAELERQKFNDFYYRCYPGEWEEFSVYEIIAKNPMPIGELTTTTIADWHGNPVSMKAGLLYRENNDIIDLGFFWEVKPIATNLSRHDYADSALTARMKIRSTNADISDLQDSVQKAITGFEHHRPLNLHLKLMDSLVVDVLKTIRQELNPDKMEKLVKWYFLRVGASQVAIPPKSASDKVGDADIIATFEAIKTIIYVQAKFHYGETDDWAVEQIDAYAKDKKALDLDNGYSHISWVISTCDTYSTISVEKAKERKILLFDGQTFTRMLLEAGLTGIDKAFE